MVRDTCQKTQSILNDCTPILTCFVRFELFTHWKICLPSQTSVATTDLMNLECEDRPRNSLHAVAGRMEKGWQNDPIPLFILLFLFVIFVLGIYEFFIFLCNTSL